MDSREERGWRSHHWMLVRPGEEGEGREPEPEPAGAAVLQEGKGPDLVNQSMKY